MFRPMLAPNEKVDLNNIHYPVLASTKLDGIRCLFIDGKILSRSLKPIQNKQLCERFEPLRKYSEEHDVILDGEIFSPELTFQEITHYVMTQDLENEKLPESLKFYAFDLIKQMDLAESFESRYRNLQHFVFSLSGICPQYTFLWIVQQDEVHSKEEVLKLFENALNTGLEGLILRDPTSRYKCGRGTIKEGLIYKLKPWETFDAKITGVVQSTEVREGAEKKTNELGHSITSKKIADRITIEKASAFYVQYEGKELKVTLAMTDEEKEEVWKNKEAYIRKTIEFKAMKIGMKDLPRHPIFLRFIDPGTK